MKTKFKMIFVGLVIAASAMTPQQSSAAIGLATGSVTWKVVGGVLSGLSGYSLLMDAGMVTSSPVALTVGAIGLILLDSNGAGAFNYAEIASLEDAKKIGLSVNEFNSYNSNVDTFNNIVNELTLSESETKLSVGTAAAYWKAAVDELKIPADAVSGLVKVSKQIMSKK